MIDLNPEFLTKNGQKEFAVIPYEEFIKLQEFLEDLQDLRKSKEEYKGRSNISFEEVKKMFNIPQEIDKT